jgi:hypothetical protein
MDIMNAFQTTTEQIVDWANDKFTNKSSNVNMLVAVNSPKHSPSDPYNYELMVSENGIDWTGVPNTKQFAGNIPLGSETHLIKYNDYYIFTAGAENGSPNAKYDVLFAYTKDFISFKHIEANFSIVDMIQSSLDVDDRGRWAPCLFEDKNNNLWVTISIQKEKTKEPKYVWQTGKMFDQYLFPVTLDFTNSKATRTGNFEKLNLDKSYVSIIDTTIHWSEKENKYICVFKDNDECVVNIATSDTVNGKYTVIKEDLFDTPFTESGFVCEMNGEYLYTCVCHSTNISPLCSYVGFGEELGKIGNIRQIKYNGSMKNVSGTDNMYLRMRMTFPIVADDTLRSLVMKNGTIIVSGFPERNTVNVNLQELLQYRNSFTALPGVCYHVGNNTSVTLNLTNTAGCKDVFIRGDSPCKISVNGYEIVNTQGSWYVQYIWSGSTWKASNYVPPYRLINFDNSYIQDIKAVFAGSNTLMFSGTPKFTSSFAKGITTTIGSTGSLGNDSYKYSINVAARGAYLVIYSGAIIGELICTPGTSNNISFRAFADISANTVGEICCPTVCSNIIRI